MDGSHHFFFSLEVDLVAGMNQTLNHSWTPAPTTSGFQMDALEVACLAIRVLALCICLCGLLGNGLVIWLLSFHFQWTPTYIYILNLAVADALFLLCVTSLVSLEIISRDSIHSKAYDVLSRAKYFTYTAGLGLLTAISTQRCLSVLFPIWYKCRRPQCLSTAVSVLLWALSFLLNLLASYFCSHFWSINERQCFTMDTMLGVLILAVFTPVLTVSSVTLFIRVRRSSRQWQWQRRPSRLFVVILASVLVFLVCALPLGVYWFILSWLPLDPSGQLLCRLISRLCSSVSSSANPLIYFLVGSHGSRRRREPLRAMLYRALQEKPELDEGETPSTGAHVSVALECRGHFWGPVSRTGRHSLSDVTELQRCEVAPSNDRTVVLREKRDQKPG
ncbi:mas-related G-protein coupled receptor member D [Tamandua tetradactyla]|uniref:mas-related G-protein coupled receptor member D n=1 Tax=Tamandua tetradactyla TaxID=48850 RepID=UPI0040544E65